MFASPATPAQPDTAVPAPAADPQAVDFEHLVGREGWWRLAPDIRHRFTEKPTAAQAIHYEGVMQQVGGNWVGALLAQVCRLIGTPFAPWRARQVPVAITLRHDPAGGVVWQREYRYAGGAPVRVESTKRIAADGALTECIGFGLGMRLAVFEANAALHFLSLRYFWRIAGHELTLPALLTPGTVHVIHADLGAGQFRFSMTIHHRLFGTLFEQHGVFAAAAKLRAMVPGRAAQNAAK